MTIVGIVSVLKLNEQRDLQEKNVNERKQVRKRQQRTANRIAMQILRVLL